MKKTVLLLSAILISLTVLAQKGKVFPNISAENVDGKVFNFCADVKGKYSILGMAFSPKAQKDLETWAQPMFTNFIEKGGGIFDDSYDVHSYMIGVFSGANSAGYETTKKQAKANVDPELLPHLLFTKNEPKMIKEELSITEKDVPYFFLLDEKGIIVHIIKGAYSDKKMEEIEKILDAE